MRTQDHQRTAGNTAARGRRLAVVLMAVLLTALTGTVAAPAYACACGAAEPAQNTDLDITSESAVVVHDGKREQIAISLGLSTNSSDLAFMMPVPTKAEVSLADEDVFSDLARHTRPEVKYRYTYFDFGGGPGSGGAPEGSSRTGGPQVLGRQQVGQYDVVQLAGDRDEVGDWLADNGFRTRDKVLDVLGTYLSKGWAVMAVKLAFEPDKSFAGDLAPLLLDFPSDELVYPMELSSLVTGQQLVRMYVFAPQRVDARIGDLPLHTTYAGAETAESLRRVSGAADLIGDRTMWLTAMEITVGPGDVTSDMSFAAADDGDTPHRDVVTRTVDRTDVTIGVLIISGIFLGGALVGWFAHVLLVRARTRTKASR
ncbi:DUF2330 domain-containing protein [Propionibacteriaceae bacterium Y1685]